MTTFFWFSDLFLMVGATEDDPLWKGLAKNTIRFSTQSWSDACYRWFQEDYSIAAFFRSIGILSFPEVWNFDESGGEGGGD